MSDENTQQQQTPQPTPNADASGSDTTPSQAQNSDSHMIPKSRFDEVNNKYKQMEAQLQELKQRQEQEREQKLAEQNEWQKLAEERAAKLAELEQAKARADAYRQQLEAVNTSRIERIPEERRTAIPEYDDPTKLSEWLDRNTWLFDEPSKPSPAPLDGGSGQRSRERGQALTDAQQFLLEQARNTGYNVSTENVVRNANNVANKFLPNRQQE